MRISWGLLRQKKKAVLPWRSSKTQRSIYNILRGNLNVWGTFPKYLPSSCLLLPCQVWVQSTLTEYSLSDDFSLFVSTLGHKACIWFQTRKPKQEKVFSAREKCVLSVKLRKCSNIQSQLSSLEEACGVPWRGAGQIRSVTGEHIHSHNQREALLEKSSMYHNLS